MYIGYKKLHIMATGFNEQKVQLKGMFALQKIVLLKKPDLSMRVERESWRGVWFTEVQGGRLKHCEEGFLHLDRVCLDISNF